MATLNLGRVRLNFRGDFAALNGNILEYFDAVTFRGSLYVVIAPNVTVVNDSLNWPPTVVGQQYYKKITQGINFTGQWSSANHYFLNDLATDGDSVYIAQQTIAPSNTPPSQSTSGWSKLNGLNLFSVGADDSTLRVINGGESIVFKGGQGIDTTSDEEGNITISNSGIVDFAVTGDDSTVRLVNSGQTLQFIGGTLVTTASDADGNITINASVAFSDLTSTPTTLAGYGITNAYTSAQVDTKISDVIAGKFSFSVAADDSTLVAINSGESINFLGGTLVTTTSDTEGNVTIDASVAFSDLTSTPTTLAGYGITDAATSAQGILANTAIQPGDNVSELANDSNYTTQTYVDNKISDVVAGRFKFGVAADDSSIVDIGSGETVSFLGGTLVTTTSDTEGNITIDASVAFSDLTSTPTTLAGYGITDGATQTYVDTEIANLIDSAPGTLDTLNELAAAINDDANFAVTIAEKLNQTLYVAADDSTLRQVRQGEAISFLGGTGISTSSDTEGNITIDGLELSVGLVDASNSLLSNVTAVSAIRFDNDSGFALDNLGSGVVKVKMNSTFKTWKSDGENDLVATGLDTIQWIAGAGIDISFNPSGSPYQTITLTNTATDYSFNVAADDSTLREITRDNTVQFLGGTNITTSSDANGNITINAAGGGDASYATFTANENITAGNLVSLRSDGKIEIAGLVLEPATSSSAVIYNSAYTNYVSAVFDPSTNKVVIFYANNGNSNFGTAVVGTISGSTVSFGTPVVFESADTAHIVGTFDSTANKIVVAYRDGGNSGQGTAIVGTVSGTSISFGTPSVFETGSTLYTAITFDSSNNKVVISYVDSGNNNFGTTVVGTVSGTSISFGSPVVFNGAGFTDNISSTFDSNTNKVIIAYRNGGGSLYGTAIVGTVSGTSISFGTPAVFQSSVVSYTSSIFDPNTNNVVISYSNSGNSSHGTSVVGTVSGTNISFGTPVVFNAATTNYIQSTYDSGLNKIIITYADGGNSNRGTAIEGTVTGSTISFSAETVYQTSVVFAIYPAYDTNQNKTLIAYADNGNNGYGTSVVYSSSYSYSNLENYVGIAKDSITATQTGAVYVLGDVADNQTNLTINQTYYITASGSLTNIPTSYGLVGRAVSATEILLHDDTYDRTTIDQKIADVSAGIFTFNVAADDSTLREITTDNTVQFVGGTLVTTTSDTNGNITIDASVAFSDLTSTPTTLAGYGITDAATSSQGTLADSSLQPGDNVSELVNDSNYTTQTYVDNKISDVVAGKFSLGVAADDSTIININSGESIKFIGGTNISTTSDTEGNITISSSGGGTASYASFTANENITAGQTVYLRSDDKIEGIKVASSGFGALNHQVSTGFTASGLPSNRYVIMVHDPNANRNVLIWRDGSTGKAAVVTHTGTSISIGSVLTFRNSFIQRVTATYDSDTNQIILMYDSAGLFFQTLTVNPNTNTVSAGTAASVSILNSYGSIVYDPSVQRFIAFYRNGTTSVDYVVGQVSGTSITLGSTATLTSGYLIYNRAVYDATAQRAVFVLTTGSWLLGAATINPSNNTATFGTITTESQPTNSHDIVYDAALGKIVFGFVKNDGLQQVKVTVLDVNPGTNAVTLNANVTLLGTGSGSVGSEALVYSPVTQKTYFSYRIDLNQYVAELSFNGSYNATITTSTTLSVNPFLQNATIVTSQDVVFIGAENSNNSVYISLIELAIQNANVDSYLGIAKDSITSGQTGEVYLLGDVADNQTNLITNQTYYVTTGGVLTTTPTAYSLVGRAVSATEILLEGDTYDRATIDQKLTNISAGIFTFNVAADDSTLREITTNNTVQFIGSSGITTSSDASGNITIAASLNLNDINDVQINTATTGEVLTYNGTNWVNQVSSSSGGTLDPIVAAIALG